MPTTCEGCSDSKTCKSKSKDVCPLFLAMINGGDLFFDPQELQIGVQDKKPKNPHRQFLTLSEVPTPDDITRIGGNRVRIRTYKGLFTCVETSSGRFKVIKFETPKGKKKRRIPELITVTEGTESDIPTKEAKQEEDDSNWREELPECQQEPENKTLRVISKEDFIQEVLRTIELKSLS